ncbi:MAG: hypothetical protein ACREBG_30525 [Pyrinomonadaceae bacterium]
MDSVRFHPKNVMRAHLELGWSSSAASNRPDPEFIVALKITMNRIVVAHFQGEIQDWFDQLNQGSTHLSNGPL